MASSERKSKPTLNYVKLNNPKTYVHRKQLLDTHPKSKFRFLPHSGEQLRIFYSAPFSEWDLPKEKEEEVEVRVYIRDKWTIGKIQLCRRKDASYIIRHIEAESDTVLSFQPTVDFHLWSPSQSFTLIGSGDSCVLPHDEAENTVLAFVEENQPRDSLRELSELTRSVTLRFGNKEEMNCRQFELTAL